MHGSTFHFALHVLHILYCKGQEACKPTTKQDSSNTNQVGGMKVDLAHRQQRIHRHVLEQIALHFTTRITELAMSLSVDTPVESQRQKANEKGEQRDRYLAACAGQASKRQHNSGWRQEDGVDPMAFPHPQ